MSTASQATSATKPSSVFLAASPYALGYLALAGVTLTASAVAVMAATSAVGVTAIALYAAGIYAGLFGVGSLAAFCRVIKAAISSKSTEEFLKSDVVVRTTQPFIKLAANLKKNPLAFVYGAAALAAVGAGIAVAVIYATPAAIVAGSVLAFLGMFFSMTIVMHVNSKYHLPDAYTSSLLKFFVAFTQGYFTGNDDPMERLKTVQVETTT